MPRYENANAMSHVPELGCVYSRNGAFTFARYLPENPG